LRITLLALIIPRRPSLRIFLVAPEFPIGVPVELEEGCPHRWLHAGGEWWNVAMILAARADLITSGDVRVSSAPGVISPSGRW